MIRQKLAQLLLVVAALCFFTSLARAQGIRVFVMGDASFLKNERFFLASGERFRSNYASGGKITLGGEFSPAKVWGLEGSYSYGRNNLRVTDLSASQTLGYGVNFHRVSANLVVHSPISFLGVEPYATGGVEYDHLGPTSQAKTLAFTQGFTEQLVRLGASNKVGFNYGAGAEWSFFPTLALRLDLRDHVTGSPTYGLASSRFPISGVAHDVELSAGLVFHIGR